MMQRKKHRCGRQTASILLVVSLFVLSGCSSSDSSGGSSGGFSSGVQAERSVETISAVVLPQCSDYPTAPQWDGLTQPTHENGSWAQSFAVFDALAEEAARLESVSPQRTFSLACHDPVDSGPGQLAAGWANAVAVATQGLVRINVGFAGSLSGAMTSLDDMKQGLIDFDWTLPCYFKGYMPLANVIQNPSLALPSGSAASQVMWELYKQSPELQSEAADDGVLLFACANCTSPISYKGDKVLEHVSDIRGNIRANNGPAQIFVNAAGANVFSCPIGEVYNNIQHGIIDFLITDWNGIDSFSLSDAGVLNHYIDTNIGCSAFVMMANTDIWNSIDAGLQEAILAASGDYMLNLVGIWDYWEALGRFNAKEKGGEIYEPSAELAAELATLYDEVAETWIESMDSPNTARGLYETAQKLAKNVHN